MRDRGKMETDRKSKNVRSSTESKV
jgi:hypothetical protein